MSYFSLRARLDSDSDSDSGTDNSCPELQTCPNSPRVGKQASSKLASMKSLSSINSVQDNYFFAGKNYLLPKPDGFSEPKTATSTLPKSSLMLQKTPKSEMAKSTSPLLGTGFVSVLKPPKTTTPLLERGSISVMKTPKPMSPLLATGGSVSVLKNSQPVTPKFFPLLEAPGPSSSKADNLPQVVHSKFRAELLESPSSSSSGVSSNLGSKEPGPQSELDLSLGEPDEKVEPRKAVLPDWHALLFGGVEKHCDEILTRPEVDTSFEDSKLAEDVALNFVTNYDMPIFDCMRDFHNLNKVSHAVKNIPKKFKSRKEQLIALLMMFDYLSCCSQEGNLLHLYEKCKDKNKIYHLESLDQSIRLVLDRIHSDRLRLDQLRSVERLVTTCIERIPSSLRVSYFSTPQALKRKLKVFEMDEKNRKENSVYSFTDVKTDSPKKLKSSSIKSTSSKWELHDLDFNDLMRTPTKAGQSSSALKSPLLASTPQSAWSVSMPTSSNSGSFKRDLLSPKDRKKSSSTSSGSSVEQKRDRSKITSWLYQKKTSSKTNTGVTSLTSKPIEKSKEVAGTSSSNKQPKIVEYSYSSDDSLLDNPGIVISESESSFYYNTSSTNIGVTSLMSKPKKKSEGVAEVNLNGSKPVKVVLETEEYSSDDSLPDIPDIVISKPESSSYSSWKRKLVGKKTPEKSVSPHSSEVKHQSVKSGSTPTCKSPFKANHSTWKSKYESPSKSNQRIDPSLEKEKSPFKAYSKTCWNPKYESRSKI